MITRLYSVYYPACKLYIIGLFFATQLRQREKADEDDATKQRIYEMKRILRDYRSRNFNINSSEEERAVDADPIVDLKNKEKSNENIWTSGNSLLRPDLLSL